MKLLFIHGYSVNNTDNYGELPAAIEAANPSIEADHLNLAKYISFRDEVTLDDISKAMHQALLDYFEDGGAIPEFAVLTHSTGAPVVRNWLRLFYGDANAQPPLTHFVMLAPANHGSGLAALGKKRIARIKTFFQGVEPGTGVLNWLCLGSEGQAVQADWELAQTRARPLEFVLTGDTIDKKLYDYVNAFTGESGSDGVVRAAAANLNFQKISITPQTTELTDGHIQIELDRDVSIQQKTGVPFALLPKTAHSGETIGIMRSVTKRNAARHPTVAPVLQCLNCETVADQAALAVAFAGDVDTNRKSRAHCMVVISVRDDTGARIDDFDVVYTAGPKYSPDKLPKGFFGKAQKNAVTDRLVIYLRADDLRKQDHLGLILKPQPDSGFVSYDPVEIRLSGENVKRFIPRDETVYLDFVLRRKIARNTFQIEDAHLPPDSFKDERPNEPIT